MNLFVLVLINSCIWAIWSAIVGYGAHRISPSFYDRHLYPVSASTIARLDLLHIKKWKDRVPEAGAMFKGGTSKKSLITLNRHGLEVLVRESRRAETVHYLIMVITPIFFLFNPLFLSIAMVIYAIVANIPCVLIQRYNRARCLQAM